MHLSMNDTAYKPSWVDRLTASIDRLPGSAWLFYLVLSAVLVALFVAIQAWQGAYREGGFFAGHIFVAVQPLYGIASIHYLDRVAANALRQFRPAMKGGEPEYKAALYRLTTSPARPMAAAGVLGAALAVAQLLLSGDPETIASFQKVATTPISLAAHNVNITVAWVGYAATAYHAYHQLKVIDWLYTSRAMIDPFHPEPLYALSDVTSRMAMLIVAAIYGWVMVSVAGMGGELPTEPLFYLTSASWILMGILIFIWPLWGAHQLLVEAKNRALHGNATGYTTAVDELHRAVTGRALDEVDVWNKALAALDMERNRLDRLATWPWSPGALRNLLVALLVPILIWILQYGLQRLIE